MKVLNNMIINYDNKHLLSKSKVELYTQDVNERVEKVFDINLYNYFRVILAETLSVSDNILQAKSKREIINNFHESFWEQKFSNISILIKTRLKNWIDSKQELGIDMETFIKNELSKSPEAFIKNLVSELELDFYNPESMWLFKNPQSSKDIPVQAKDALQAWVSENYNWTIWVLKNKLWHIVSNKRVRDILKMPMFDIDRTLNYHPWVWIESYRRAMELLIQHEEKIYNWPKSNSHISRPYFVPGWGGWLTLIRDYFLSEGELVLLPNYRWPNIDGIIMNKTKVPPAQINLIWQNGKMNITSISSAIKNAIESWRNKISLYLNFPSNPSGIKLSVSDKKILNAILVQYKHEDISIQLILDDPYWAFSVDNYDKTKVDAPLSYYIDTSNNVTVFELWSHGTKEAWVYGLRAGVLRVFWNKDNINKYDKIITTWLRETFSMSPTLPQEVMVKSILWNDIDPYRKEDIDVLTKDNIHHRISNYIDARNQMLTNVFPRIDHLKNEILKLSWKYLVAMDNEVLAEKNTGWFMICFTLSDYAVSQWITLNKLQEVCFHNFDGKNDNRCAFTIFDDTVNNCKAMRITLMSCDEKEYAKRLQNWIEKISEK